MGLSGQLADAWPEWNLHEGRRMHAAFKRNLYTGNYDVAVQKMARERIADAETAREVARFVNTAHGLFGVVADTCSVVYQRGVRRELYGAPEPAAKAFADLVDESDLSAIGTSINALAWATGPVVVVPYVDDVLGEPRLCLEVVTQDRCEVRRHRSAPDVVEALLFQRDDGAFVEVDAWGWRYYDSKGESLDAGAFDTAHNLTYCPAAVLRARPRLAGDWHGSTDHHGLASAALECAYLSALGRWTRTQTAAPLTVVTAPDDKYAKGQSIAHPSRPLVFDADPSQVSVEVKDRTTDPRHYLSEIQALAASAVARYQLPPSAVSFVNDNSNWGTLSIAMTPGALAAQRDAQTPRLRTGERALWLAACDVARASNHRHARRLPSRDEVAATLRVAFPDLSDAAEQIRRMEAFTQRLPHGLASPEDELMRERPELTRAEAAEEIVANLEGHTRRITELASRNVAADPGRGIESIAQLQGRVGGIASGEVRRETAAQENQNP